MVTMFSHQLISVKYIRGKKKSLRKHPDGTKNILGTRNISVVKKKPKKASRWNKKHTRYQLKKHTRYQLGAKPHAPPQKAW